MENLAQIRKKIRSLHSADESEVLADLIDQAAITEDTRSVIVGRAAKLVEDIRADDKPGLMEVFLAEYGLSTDEGVALMCLAEALLRVPDATTIDDLIEDKIAPSSWGEHLGKSSSSLVNASTWALMLTGKVLDEERSSGISGVLHSAIKRVGEPVIRAAVKRAMQEMGSQFVLGESIENAHERGLAMQSHGYTYSYDMLGEAALTEQDAQAFLRSYTSSIDFLATKASSQDIRENPGISIKLSALHPRYEVSQTSRVMNELVPRVKALAIKAKDARMGFNIDAEEANRLDLSLDVIEAVLRSPELAGWDGFGVVVQAYGKRASGVLDWLYALSKELDRNIMVRLVKGAYWDSEIKQAQIDGVNDFPVFTQKSATDVSYICCAGKLLSMTDRVYPQFATHNAHTVSAILALANDKQLFEFQKLHGMGDSLYKVILRSESARCRIYAPVGVHKDLLAYLVRRLLENGANSSFVNQIVDANVPAEHIAADPFEKLENGKLSSTAHIAKPTALYLPERANSLGWDLSDLDHLRKYDTAREPFSALRWTVAPMIARPAHGGVAKDVFNPADVNDQLGSVTEANDADVESALSAASHWGSCSPRQRGEILNKAADLYEQNAGEIFAVLCREAGKTTLDAVAEIREAVDFLRYYGARAADITSEKPRGLITCISPWNFPLAIFTGQISAALAAGNGVLAKPADPTPITASIGVRLMHEAGVPENVLQLLPGRGSVVGAKLTSDPRINGVCFTGSTAVAQTINKTMAENLEPDALFIAETGGLNAMIVDSTALPEQAVKDIVVSSFQSAGQRCSALRLLYIQEDVVENFLTMLYGAMDELDINLPWHFSTDVGPVINKGALTEIEEYIDQAQNEGRLLKRMPKPEHGLFVGPSVISVSGIKDLEREVFGPVLHVATFKPHDIDRIVDDINNSRYGLTFGLHTRIDDRVQKLSTSLNVGNIYVNRNQIGAVVGSQPFGGEGLSGTGPKAGGPHYVKRFLKTDAVSHACLEDKFADIRLVQAALNNIKVVTQKPLFVADLPGPTGESNRLSTFPRGVVLCLGPTPDDAYQQAKIAEQSGCSILIVAPGVTGSNAVNGFLDRGELTSLSGFDVVALWSEEKDLRKARVAIAKRNGPIIPMATTGAMTELCILERHICIDTTAAGGNASLLAAG